MKYKNNLQWFINSVEVNSYEWKEFTIKMLVTKIKINKPTLSRYLRQLGYYDFCHLKQSLVKMNIIYFNKDE